MYESKPGTQYCRIIQDSYLFYSQSRPPTVNTIMHTRFASIPQSLTIFETVIVLSSRRIRRAWCTITHSITLSDLLYSIRRMTFCATKSSIQLQKKFRKLFHNVAAFAFPLSHNMTLIALITCSAIMEEASIPFHVLKFIAYKGSCFVHFSTLTTSLHPSTFKILRYTLFHST